MRRAWIVVVSLAAIAGCSSPEQADGSGGTTGDSGGDTSVVTTLPTTTVDPTTGLDAGESSSEDDDSTTNTVDEGSTGSTETGNPDTGDTDTTGPGDTSTTDTGTATGTGTTGDQCGNGSVDVGEECDADDLDGMDCTDQGFTGGVLACDGGCNFVTDGCVTVSLAPGDLVITEIMQNPETLSDADGEWFEIHNPGITAEQIGYCTITGNMSDTGFTIEASLVVPAGGYVTFAQDSASGDPGFAEDYLWPGGAFSLNNTSDRVALECDGVVIDEVTYDNGATFPNPVGRSMTLQAASITAGANDSGSNWCEGTTLYNGGDYGTPGAANDSCVAYSVDFCRLQSPVTINDAQGTDVDVFGRVYIAGLTDSSGGNDPAPEVRSWVGYGPDGTNPASSMAWVWTEGAPNVGYGVGSPSYEANNDEYQATLTVPAAGNYDFAFRFSGDSGLTFSYCDGGDPGSSNGYAAADAGQMTAN